MKRISIFILSLLTCIGMFGQQIEQPEYLFSIMTPEAASLGRFGAYPVSHYTGGVDIKIPLYTLETRNTKVPIYLQYDGTGFIPNKYSGKVGHDWTLVAGGIITRTVNGVPDEWGGRTGAVQDFHLDGHLFAQRQGVVTPTNNDILNLNYISNYETDIIDTEPDLFTFNFGEHHGQFIISHEGNNNVKVIGGGGYKVDISEFKSQSFAALDAETSITITTPDGTKYTFGGMLDALEMNLIMHLNSSKDNYIATNGVISALYLTEIETPDGETVTFTYREGQGYDQTEGFVAEDSNNIRNAYYADSKYAAYGNDVEWTTGNPKSDLSFSYVRTAYLEKISASCGGEVLFNYDERKLPYCDRNSNATKWNNAIPLYLNNVKVKNVNEKTIKNIKLHQSFIKVKNANLYRMFLDRVSTADGDYIIQYADTSNLPSPHTRGVDLQGYYNGQDSNETLLPSGYDFETGGLFTTRQPNADKAVLGMISRIVYPTGGTTTFTFEGHRYGTAIRKYSNQSTLSTVLSQGNIGGVRIKKIANDEGESVEYIYETTDSNGNNISSGVFNDIKKYAFSTEIENGYYGINRLFVYDANNLVRANSFSESDIVYSRVKEVRGNGRGYSVYDFTTYIDHPDILNLGTGTYSYLDSTPTESQKVFLSSFMGYTSNRLERGKLTSLCEYNSSSQLLRKISYTYNTDANRKESAVYGSGVRFSLSNYTAKLANSVAYYYYPNLVSKQTVEEYSNGVYQTTTTTYVYNADNSMISEEYSVNSDNNSFLKKFYYPQDFTTTVCKAMVAANMLNPIVKEEYYVNNSLEKSIENEYAKFNDKYYDLSVVKQTIGNTTCNLLTIHARDAHRNVISFTEFGKPSTCLLWGYCYQYPVAKLDGLAYSTFNTGIAASVRESIADSGNPYTSHETILKGLASSFPAAHVTLYEYQPQVGMTFSLEPNQKQMYYTYNAQNRLTNVAIGSSDGVLQNFTYYLKSYSPFSVTLTNTISNLSIGSKTFGVKSSGGSGEYTYSLKIMRGNTILKSGSTSSITYNFTTPGSYTFSGWVEDNITLEKIEFSHSFTIEQPVTLPVISFTEKVQHVYESYGNYYSTAIIECEQATTVEFSFSATLDQGSYSVIIGDNPIHSGSYNSDEKISVNLEAGTNYVELRLYNASNAELYLIMSEAEGAEIGSDPTLTVSTERAEY